MISTPDLSEYPKFQLVTPFPFRALGHSNPCSLLSFLNFQHTHSEPIHFDIDRSLCWFAVELLHSAHSIQFSGAQGLQPLVGVIQLVMSLKAFS